MKSDFDIICRRFYKPLKIYPIADVHFGAINHESAAWLRFCNMIEKDDNAYLVLDGDLLNNNTRSSVGSPWDDTVRPREAKRMMVEYLAPVKDKILCMTSGNHERRSMKDADDDPTYDIACKLDIEDRYRQNAAFLKIGVGETNKGEGRRGEAKVSYNIALTHGAGGGIYTGATVNRNERWGNVIDGVDCVIVGHTHKGTVTRPSKLVFDPRNNKITIKEYVVISCVSWQAYSEYALQKMMLPSTTARPQVMYLDNKKKDIEVRW
jgi:UDP-2,3-diacylglucosamine pyrophosphatase LpxH